MPDIDTSALNTGAANFETHQWVQIDADTLMVKGTKAYYAFSAIFVILGDILFVAGVVKLSGFLGNDSAGGWVLIAVGILFFSTGLLTYRNCNRQIIINRQLGFVQVQQWLPVKPDNISNIVMEILPDNLAAVQLLSHPATLLEKNRKTKPITQYQVNVAKKSGERENILISLKSDKAQTLTTAIADMFTIPTQLHPHS